MVTHEVSRCCPPFKAGDRVLAVKDNNSLKVLDQSNPIRLERFKKLIVKSVMYYDRIPTWILTFKGIRGSFPFLYFEKTDKSF